MIKRIRIVFRKEVIDNIRDRRTMTAALFYPLLGPLLFALIMSVLGKVTSEQSEQKLDLAVTGAENAPGLIRFLEEEDVKIKPGPQNPEEEVRAGNLDVVLIIPEGYGEDLRKGKPATVRVIVDKSRQSASVPRRRIGEMIESYSQSIGRLRLLARGISPAAVHPLAIEVVDVATPQSRAAGVLNSMLPYFIIFSVFIGGLYISIDTTTGERERGSLEPLLMNPVKRSEFVLGKLLATLLFTVVAVIESLLGFMVLLGFVSFEELGLRSVHLAPSAVLSILLITMPIMLLAASLQMIIATFTRSFKEAQTYLSILPLVPALPSMVLAFLPVKVKLWMMLIPTFGQQLLINQIMRGEPIQSTHVVASAAVTIFTGIVLTYVVARVYEKEAVVFGR